MLTYSKTIYKTDPFLTIITRKYKRPVGITRNLQSICEQTDLDAEQIFITDHCGLGMLSANTSFGNPEVREMVTGKYVYLLDDDDYLVNPEFIAELKRVDGDPDVICFRMNIIPGPNGDLYPTPETWTKEPKIAHIGGSCFAIKREVYLEFIHHFAKVRCGDFAFVHAIWSAGKSFYWLDKLMASTGSIGRGKPEINA